MNAPVIEFKYRIGIDEMDAQHAKWVQLIERFRAAAADHLCDATGIAAAREALTALLDYTHRHFRSEEHYLESHRYPDLAAHRQHHKDIVAALDKLLGEIDNANTHAPLKLNLFITIWLLEHIMNEDWDYAQFVLRRQTGATPTERLRSDPAAANGRKARA